MTPFKRSAFDLRSAFVLLFAALWMAPWMYAASVYPNRPPDAKAVYLERGVAGARGDGVQDDTAAIQAAIDRVEETTGQGIVFVGEGRYRISRTLMVWPGVRVIGYGVQRPVLVLGARTPGYDKDMAYMVMFAGGRTDGPQRPGARRRPGSDAPFPGVVPARAGIVDANPGTFYSAMSNVDLEIGDGNPGAVGIRSHYAQHCFLTHMDFRLGSGMAGIHDAGNEAEDLHFYGGAYGIVTGKPSPGWQFTLLDSSFEGQRKAAIREHEAGLTLVHATIRDVPEAVEIDAGYAEEMWVQNSRFENISGPAITISNEKNARTEINVQNVSCKGVPVFARFRESGKELRGAGGSYRVARLSHGLTVEGVGGRPEFKTTFEAKAGTEAPAEGRVVRSLPPQTSWVDLRSLGAKGDGVTDDTEAILRAIAGHDAIYVPMGRYRVTRTIALRPGTALIGMHPSTTQFFLDDESPEFSGEGGPVPLLLAPSGGKNIVQGIGLYAGGSNRRAVGAMWMAGADSLMDDVRFLGGHGTNNADGSRANPYNANHSGDPDPKKRWDAQFPSLWVLNGGGGVFTDIWTPDTFAQAGMYVSDTKTRGRVYELSSEHHVRTEVKLDHVANWELIALQTEEEWGEGGAALPLEIESSRDVLVANFHSYRVVGSRQTAPYAIRVANSSGIEFRNVHIDSDSKVSFNDAVYDATTEASGRDREFAVLTVMEGGSRVPDREPQVVRLAGGFDNVSGATVDGQGRLYFVDPKPQKIYRWTPATRAIEVLRDAPVEPVNLWINRSGALMVVCYGGDGTVYRFDPDGPLSEWAAVSPQAAPATLAGKDVYLPADLWAMRSLLRQPESMRRTQVYLSADGSAAMPAGEDFIHGALYYGTKMADVLRSFELVKTAVGKHFYMTDEEEQKTYVGTVGDDGSVRDIRLFAERGGESVVVGPNGHVYLAAGEIFEYDPDGSLVREIDTPERPIDLIFGGKDGTILFVLARTGVYQVSR